jgi:hypothetical protein
MSSELQTARKQPRTSSSLSPYRMGSGKPLDGITRGFMESRFGQDFSKVRIHADHDAHTSAERMNAHAYTIGHDIVFGAGAYDRQRLAHELTHVVQQSGSASSSTHQDTESEARRNSEHVASGFSGHVQHGMAPGTVQRDDDDDPKKKKIAKEKPEGEFSMGSTSTLKPGSVKNKFGFSGEASIPLLPGAKLGPVLFFDKLKLTSEGSAEIDATPGQAQLPGPQDIRSMQTEAALGLLKLELPKFKKLEEKGITLGAGIEGTGKLSYDTGEKGLGASIGTTGTASAAYKSPSLLPSSVGELKLSSKLNATGSLERTYGADAKGTAKATGKATVGADYKSPELGGPAATVFGILGDKATLSLGGEASASGTLTQNDPVGPKDKPATAKLGASGTLGLTGTGKDQRFVKLKVSGEAAIDLIKGGLDPSSKATILDLSVGFKF